MRGNILRNLIRAEEMVPLETIIVTERMTRTMPKVILGVITSPNTNIPINKAVTGSNAPRMAVGVEPIYWIALVVQTKEIAVGKIASPSKLSQTYHLLTNINLVPQPSVKKKKRVPKSNT